MSQSKDIVITVESREDLGKAESGRLRRSGRVPAVLYGGGMDPVSISVEERAVQEILKQESGENTMFLLKLAGTDQERQAMIKDLQVDPISRHFKHIDFIRVTKGHKLSVTIPIELSGDCVGVRHGGLVEFVSRELDVELLPREMFDRLEVDISDLDIGEHITVAELKGKLPSSARFLEDAGRVVVLVAEPRGPSAEEEEIEAAAAATVITEAAEPEVIRSRGRDQEGDES
jgi:large subunit ribosomal protein L25